MHNAIKIVILTFILTTQISLASTNASELPELVKKHIPNVAQVGKTRVKILFWKLYDATLFAPQGLWQSNQPFALKLNYLREIKGSKIVEETIRSIKQQGMTDQTKLNHWQQKTTKIFPDVKPSTEIIGLVTKEQTTIFIHNNTQIGQIEDPEFTHYFFNIWLGPKAEKPKFRNELLNKKQ